MKNLKLGVRLTLIVVILVVVSSCNRNPLSVNVSGVDIDLTYKNYDDDLFKAKGNLEQEIPKLQEEYGRFFELFNLHMIGVGMLDDDGFYTQLASFLNDTMIVNLNVKVNQRIDKGQLEQEFIEAFKHYRYYFPDRVIPDVYTCVSGLNQSIVLADSLIGVSLDKYLGADFDYYPRLGIPEYKIRNMHQQKIVPDAMYFWASTEHPISLKASKVVENMIYQGSLYYFVDAMLPELNDTLKIGFTENQLEFCQNSEANMWNYMAEQNLLFSTNRMDIKRYVDDGPYVSVFSTDSPGRVGAWLGWQIVRSYMKNNPEVTLKQLMENKDYLSILNQSGYQPD